MIPQAAQSSCRVGGRPGNSHLFTVFLQAEQHTLQRSDSSLCTRQASRLPQCRAERDCCGSGRMSGRTVCVNLASLARKNTSGKGKEGPQSLHSAAVSITNWDVAQLVECLPSIQKGPGFDSPVPHKRGCVVFNCV